MCAAPTATCGRGWSQASRHGVQGYVISCACLSGGSDLRDQHAKGLSFARRLPDHHHRYRTPPVGVARSVVCCVKRRTWAVLAARGRWILPIGPSHPPSSGPGGLAGSSVVPGVATPRARDITSSCMPPEELELPRSGRAIRACVRSGAGARRPAADAPPGGAPPSGCFAPGSHDQQQPDRRERHDQRTPGQPSALRPEPLHLTRVACWASPR